MAFLAFFYAILALAKSILFAREEEGYKNMLCLKGYNRLLKKWIEMKSLDDGTVLADA